MEDLILNHQTPAKPHIGRIAGVTLSAVALLGTGFWFGNNYRLTYSSPFAPRFVATSSLEILNDPLVGEVKELMQTKYLRRSDLDQKKLLYGAITGMVASAGDPYTSFFDPSQNKNVESQLSGTYEGIGAQLGYKNKQLVVVAPIKDSPAAASGVKAGDYLLKIDSRSTNGMNLSDAVDLIRGKANTTVMLTLVRDGSDKPIILSLTRKEITIKSIDLTYKDNPATPDTDTDVAYLKLNRFGDTTISEWDAAVADIKAKGAKELVLDLRDNPGGYLEAAIHIGSEFFKDGKIVGEQNAQGQKTYSSVDHVGQLINLPTSVLINKGSASASEIVSGALQARNRAKLLGENSFGKGSVQQVIELSQGTSLHVTIAKWLLPNDKNIDQVGIKPDIEVKSAGTDTAGGTDAQLDAAIKQVTTP